MRLAGFLFVDDTDLLQSERLPGDTYFEVAEEAQRAVDMWEGGIRATGGAINPEKSYWYLISFKWSGGITKYATVDETEATLTVNDKDGQEFTLTRVYVDEARKSIGVFHAPDGNNKAQVRYLRDIAVKWKTTCLSGIYDAPTRGRPSLLPLCGLSAIH